MSPTIRATVFAFATMASVAYGAPLTSTFHEEFVRQAQNGLGGACALKPQALPGPHVGIYVPYTLMPSDQGTGTWGGGLIDNLRGYFGDICNPQDWQAVPDAAGTGLIATFYVEPVCTGGDVAGAIHAASYSDAYPDGLWMICNDELGEQFSATGGFLAQLGVAGVDALAAFV